MDGYSWLSYAEMCKKYLLPTAGLPPHRFDPLVPLCWRDEPTAHHPATQPPTARDKQMQQGLRPITSDFGGETHTFIQEQRTTAGQEFQKFQERRKTRSQSLSVHLRKPPPMGQRIRWASSVLQHQNGPWSTSVSIKQLDACLVHSQGSSIGPHLARSVQPRALDLHPGLFR